MYKKLYITILLFALALGVRAGGTYTETSKLASGRWVKIRVSDEGVYQLTRSQLANMGFSNPASVCLYGYNTPIMPELNLHTYNDDLTEIPVFRRDDGTILFYSCGTVKWSRISATATTFTHKTNPYTKYIYYFLSEGTPALFRMETPATEPTRTANTFPEHILLDYDEKSVMNSGRTFFEAYDYANGATRNYDLPTPGIVSGSNVTVSLQFIAGAASSVNINAGSTSLGQLKLNAPAKNTKGTVASGNFTLKDHSAQSATLTLNHTHTTATYGHLDYIRASYMRNLSMSGASHLTFRTLSANNYKVTISDAQSDTRVWKVTNPDVTCEQEGKQTGTTYEAQLTNSGMDEYVAVNINSAFPEPEYVGEVANQNLHGLKDLDFVIIVPATGLYTSVAQKLADAHRDLENMRCAVITADKIYNEFSSGTPDMTAYRRLMKMLYDRADSIQNAPKNVLLFGPCYWDNRMVTPGLAGKNPENCLLTYQSANSWSETSSYVNEEYIGLLDDNEGKKPLSEKADIGIGRIPCTSLSQANSIVNKLISYIRNENAGAWKNTICMMADDGNYNIHMSDAESILQLVRPLYPDFYYKHIYWDAYSISASTTGKAYADVANEINNTMQTGALIMNYTGHGNPTQLSHEAVMRISDFENWNSPFLPLWITAACDVAPFDMNEKNIAMEALANDEGAAMGFIGTTRTVYSSYNRAMNQRLMRRLLETDKNGEHYTIGEALIQAKCDLVTMNSDSINKTHFVLLGDPAITLAYPRYKISIDQINGEDIDKENLPKLSAGQVVSVTGHIQDVHGDSIKDFNGRISPRIFDSLVRVDCKMNSAEVDTAFWFYDYNRTLYNGTSTVKDGRFSFSFPVPLDLNYSNEKGLMNLYAISDKKEAQISFTDFIVGGTGQLKNDLAGPTIKAWLNTEKFTNGDDVHESPWLNVNLHDPNGINVTGNGVGHDIMAIIDNNEATSYSLNNYFTQNDNDYTSGTVGFPIPELDEGEHTLLIRAFDIYNNVSTKTLRFKVVKGLKPELADMKIFNSNDPSKPIYDQVTIQVINNRKGTDLDVMLRIYSTAGQLLYETEAKGKERRNNADCYTFKWNITETRGSLKPDIYIARMSISTSDGKEAHIAKKFFTTKPSEQ